MENKKNICRKFVILSALILVSVCIYLYARVFAKALDSGIGLTWNVAWRILGRSGASLLGMLISATLIASWSVLHFKRLRRIVC